MDYELKRKAKKTLYPLAIAAIVTATLWIAITIPNDIDFESNRTDCSFVIWENYNISVMPGAVISEHWRMREGSKTGIAVACRMDDIKGGLVAEKHLGQDQYPLEYIKSCILVGKKAVPEIVVTDNSSLFCGYPAYAGYADLDEGRTYFRAFKPEPYAFGSVESTSPEFFGIVRIDPA